MSDVKTIGKVNGQPIQIVEGGNGHVHTGISLADLARMGQHQIDQFNKRLQAGYLKHQKERADRGAVRRERA